MSFKIAIAHGVKDDDTLRKYVRATGESPCDRRVNGKRRKQKKQN